MNILVIGSGGREHALCWKLRASSKVKKLYCAPGNGGTLKEAQNVALEIGDHRQVIDFCKREKIDLAVIGPEAPLAVGITDDLEKAGIKVFGPSYAASRMESSKIFAKELMAKYNIPTASFRIFDDFAKAEEYIKVSSVPIVVKAYGLAAGKGVIIAQTREAAVLAAEDMLVKRVFGAEGQKIIVEEYLEGEEASILVLTDGTNIVPLASSQDHKRALDGDEGPNTGGMGAYSPTPVVDGKFFSQIMDTIVIPTIEGLKKEKILYKGVLYVGIMITSQGPKVLEYNVRFGDPETQVILPRIKSDMAEVLMAAAKGDISGENIDWDERKYVCVVLTAGGYPGKYEKNKVITGIKDAEKEGALIFHAGTALESDKIVTSGGRVLNVVAGGKNIDEAIKNTYRAVKKITFEGMHYRRDIAARGARRAKKTQGSPL